MHETGIVRDLVRRLQAAAGNAGAIRVAGVSMRLGALSAFSPAHFQEHFEAEARGTLAEGAALQILVSDDVTDPQAQDVVLESIDLEIDEE